MRCSAVLAVAGALLAAACQPLPKPFAHEGAPDRTLLALPDGAGIIVMPVDDAGPATSDGLVAAMVAALHQANVPATAVAGNRRSAVLYSRIVDDGRDPMILWELFAADTTPLGAVEQPIDGVAVAPWAAGEAGLMGRLARRAAPEVAGLIQGGAPAGAAPPPLYVRQVEGAPGDGNVRLRHAMATALRTFDLEVAARRDATTLVVAGSVDVAPDPRDPRRDRVAIAWTVFDPFGVPVGTIDQANSVTRGSFAERWGEAATSAAQAGAVAIAGMVHRIDWRGGFARAGDGPGAPPERRGAGRR